MPEMYGSIDIHDWQKIVETIAAGSSRNDDYSDGIEKYDPPREIQNRIAQVRAEKIAKKTRGE